MQANLSQTRSPRQSPFLLHWIFWQPTFSSVGLPKNPSGQVQTGRWPWAVQTALRPQITGPAQASSHSNSPVSENLSKLIFTDLPN